MKRNFSYTNFSHTILPFFSFIRMNGSKMYFFKYNQLVKGRHVHDMTKNTYQL